MVSLSTWFRYTAHKFEYYVSLSWKMIGSAVLIMVGRYAAVLNRQFLDLPICLDEINHMQKRIFCGRCFQRTSPRDSRQSKYLGIRGSQAEGEARSMN